jgi:chemotaxis protein CheZ
MSGTLTTRDASESDYEAIQLAVMETERGRWFLEEFARRNRHADTGMLVASIAKLERAVGGQREPSDLDKFRLNVLEMSRAIARTRAEIAAIKPPETDGRIMEASGELDSIVSATETATSEILAAAECVQEVAWTLREAGAGSVACDQLDHHAVAIYTACSFQDLTAQRTRKVTDILSFLETRVNAMADIWQFAEADLDANTAAEAAAPAAPDPSMSQADVDFVLIEKELERADIAIELSPADAPPPIPPAIGAVIPDTPPSDDFELDMTPAGAREYDMELAPDILDATTPVHGHIDDILFERPDALPPPFESRPALTIVGADTPAQAMFAKAKGGQTLTAEEAAAALDALQGMSVEERTKLFS